MVNFTRSEIKYTITPERKDELAILIIDNVENHRYVELKFRTFIEAVEALKVIDKIEEFETGEMVE